MALKCPPRHDLNIAYYVALIISFPLFFPVVLPPRVEVIAPPERGSIGLYEREYVSTGYVYVPSTCE